MPESDQRSGLFPALLKHWRRQRGLSQLDLAIAADVSARHISFLETGRSTPSTEMVLRLGSTLGVPLRQVNEMLRAAGHDAFYEETDGALPGAVAESLTLMHAHHEPYPLIVVDRLYRIRSLNSGAASLLCALLGIPPVDPDSIALMDLNLALLSFDPNGAQPLLVNFDEVGRHILWRIQREVLEDPNDADMHAMLEALLAMPTVDSDWRETDLSEASDPALVLHLRSGDLDLRFLTMITAFQAPQNVALEHLRIETWFPYDEATADACRQLAATNA